MTQEVQVSGLLKQLPRQAYFPAIINGQPTILAKMSRDIIGSFGDPFPVYFQIETGLYPTGSAIRFLVEIPQPSGTMYRFQCFLNPGSDVDLADLREFAAHDTLGLHFYDSVSNPIRRMGMPLPQSNRNELEAGIKRALAHNLTVKRPDWERTKRAMMHDRPLDTQ